MWAGLVKDLHGYVNNDAHYNDILPDQVKIWCAIDIETWSVSNPNPNNQTIYCGGTPLYAAPAKNTTLWAENYSNTASVPPYFNFGNYTESLPNLGKNTWGADFTWYVSWGLPTAYPLPEIYNTTTTNSKQWHDLARYSVLCTAPCLPVSYTPTKGRTMQYWGVLTQFGDAACSIQTNAPKDGWQQLYGTLTADVFTEQSFPASSSYLFYSTDIAKDSGQLNGSTTADTCLP
jgi:hypothetical protein